MAKPIERPEAHFSGLTFIPDRTGLFVPSNGRDPLRIPADEDVLKYQPPPNHVWPTRPSAELALAVSNPWLFLANEIAKKLPPDEEGAEVVAYLQARGITQENTIAYSSAAIQRRKQTRRIRDWRSDEAWEQESTVAGAVEQAGIALLDLLSEPSFTPEARRIVVLPLSQMLQDYRLHTTEKRETPEMPDLIMQIISGLERFSAQPETRFALYGILEQITIPESLGCEVLQRMDRYQDLDHPLAFQLTLEEAKRQDSAWISTQEERRAQLLERLAAPNQELFDRFEELVQLSRGLVYHGDPRRPQAGKVGLEIEFMSKRTRKNGIYGVRKSGRNLAMSQKYFQRGKGIADKWAIHRERNRRDEATRADNHLEYGQEYEESLVDLYKWLGDYARSLDALHIHLDSNRHPFLPKLGGLYEGQEPGRQSTHTVGHSSKGLDSWEIRSVALPRGIGNFHPGRLADVIGLYIGASSFENKTDDLPKIDLAKDSVSLPQLLWGHLVTFIQDPKIRLAALMTLHDSQALRYCNPLAFIHTYNQESLIRIAASLRPIMKSKEDQAMIRFLDQIGRQETDDLLHKSSAYTFILAMVRYVLGERLVEQITKHDYRFIPDKFDWYHRHKAMLLRKYKVTPFNRLPERAGETGEFERDKVIKHIKHDAIGRVQRKQDVFQRDASLLETMDLKQRKKIHELEYQRALRFDEEFLRFIGSYLFNMYDTYDPNELKMVHSLPEKWQGYTTDKNQQLSRLVHLFFTLEGLSDNLVRSFVEGRPVDFDVAFSFDEEPLFQERMQQLFADVLTFNNDSPNADVARMWRVHDSIGKTVPIFESEKRSRQLYSASVALLFWAHEHGITDERLDPVKKVIAIAYSLNNLPTEYDSLLKHGFLGINAKNLSKPSSVIGPRWKEF